MNTDPQKLVRLSRLPRVLQEMLASEDAAVVALAEQIATLPSPDPLCPFCVVVHDLQWPDYATPKLCAEHLPVARALQCRDWNTFTRHQRLAALARWGRLPDPVEWWPERLPLPHTPTPQEGDA